MHNLAAHQLEIQAFKPFLFLSESSPLGTITLTRLKKMKELGKLLHLERLDLHLFMKTLAN